MNSRSWINSFVIFGLVSMFLTTFGLRVEAALALSAITPTESTATRLSHDAGGLFPGRSNHETILLLPADTPLLSSTSALTVTKSAVNQGDVTLRPGERITYTIVISNGDSLPVTGGVVSDTFPANTSFVAGSIDIDPPGAGNAGSQGTQPVLASDITIPGGDVVTVIYAVDVNPGVANGTDIINTAVVTSTEVPTPTSASVVNTVTNEANLGISKSNGQTTTAPGETTTYTIVVTNTGPSPVTGATVSDTFPGILAGVNWSCTGAGGGTCPGSGMGDINTNAVNLPVGARVTFVATGTVNSTASGSLINTATVTAPAGVTDPPGNNSATDTDTLVPEADLRISKSNGQSSTVPGETTTYTIVVTNTGPSPANSATVTDNFPGILTDVTWNCTPFGGGICPGGGPGQGNINTLVNLPAGARVTFVATGMVSPGATGTLVNTATVTAPPGVTDPVSNNNRMTDTDTLTPRADLRITKSNGQNTTTPGEMTTYTIVVTNTGPSQVTGATVSDDLPGILTGVTWNCTPFGGGTCSPNNGNTDINATVNLPVGARVTFTVNGTVSAGATGTLVNTATVTLPPGVTDPTTPNRATDSDTLTPRADLVISKSNGQSSTVPGETTTYTIVVTNTGPSAVTGATVFDDFPATLTGVTWTCTVAGGGACPGGGTGDINTNAVNLPVGARVTFVATGTVNPAAIGTLVNTATVTAPPGVTDPTTPNSATDSDTLTPEADLRITKSDSPDPVLVGNDLTYTIGVTNSGPSHATNVVVTDNLPAGVNFQSATPTTGTCNPPSGGTVTCNLGTLNKGSSAGVTIVVKPQSPGTLTNTVTVNSSVTDPGPGANNASTTTLVKPKADLAVAKTVAVEGPPPLNPPVAGRHSLLYTLVVNNLGPSPATQVVVVDNLPSQVSFTSATPSQGSCSHAGGVVTCNLNTIPFGGGPVTINIRAAIKSSALGTFTNTATVSSTVGDENTANNTSSVPTTVTTEADLVISKSDTPDPALIGSPLTYRLTITNTGPSDAASVVVTDTLPGNVTFSSASAGCSHAAGKVTCNLGTVVKAGVRTINIVVVPTAVGTLNNTATVTSSTTDKNTGNNTATQSSQVKPSADLQIQKSDSPDPVTAGQNLIYTLTVVNNGPSTATGVVVVDTLPAGLAHLSTTTSRGSCSFADGKVTCSLGNMASGSSATITIRVRVDPLMTGTLSNTASVQGNETDPKPGNNSANQATTVKPPLEYSSFLPVVLKPAPTTFLYVRNDNTGGNVQFTVFGTSASCSVANNETKFCGSFPPGTYNVQVVTSTCGSNNFVKTYNAGTETTRVFCN